MLVFKQLLTFFSSVLFHYEEFVSEENWKRRLANLKLSMEHWILDIYASKGLFWFTNFKLIIFQCPHFTSIQKMTILSCHRCQFTKEIVRPYGFKNWQLFFPHSRETLNKVEGTVQLTSSLKKACVVKKEINNFCSKNRCSELVRTRSRIVLILCLQKVFFAYNNNVLPLQ